MFLDDHSILHIPIFLNWLQVSSLNTNLQPIQLQPVQYIFIPTQTTTNSGEVFFPINATLHIKSYKSSYCLGFETKTIETQNYWDLKRLLFNLLFKKSHLGSWVSVVRTMFRGLFYNSTVGNSTNSYFQSPLQWKRPFLIFRHLLDL